MSRDFADVKLFTRQYTRFLNRLLQFQNHSLAPIDPIRSDRMPWIKVIEENNAKGELG